MHCTKLSDFSVWWLVWWLHESPWQQQPCLRHVHPFLTSAGNGGTCPPLCASRSISVRVVNFVCAFFLCSLRLVKDLPLVWLCFVYEPVTTSLLTQKHQPAFVNCAWVQLSRITLVCGTMLLSSDREERLEQNKLSLQLLCHACKTNLFVSGRRCAPKMNRALCQEAHQCSYVILTSSGKMCTYISCTYNNSVQLFSSNVLFGYDSCVALWEHKAELSPSLKLVYYLLEGVLCDFKWSHMRVNIHPFSSGFCCLQMRRKNQRERAPWDRKQEIE